MFSGRNLVLTFRGHHVEEDSVTVLGRPESVTCGGEALA